MLVTLDGIVMVTLQWEKAKQWEKACFSMLVTLGRTVTEIGPLQP